MPYELRLREEVLVLDASSNHSKADSEFRIMAERDVNTL